MRIDVVRHVVDGFLDLLHGLYGSLELPIDEREVDAGLRVVGTQVDRPEKAVHGPLRLPHSMQDGSQVPVQHGVVGQDREGSLVECRGVRKKLCREVHVAELYRRGDVLGLQRECSAVRSGGLFQVPEPRTRIAQLDMRRAIVAVDGCRLAQMFAGVLRSTELIEDEAEVVIRARVLGLQVKEVLVVFAGRLKVLLLVGDHAKHEDGVRALLLRQYAPTLLLRLVQAAVPVVLLGHVGPGSDFVPSPAALLVFRHER